MRGQGGSVLVGVLAISLALTLAAGSLLATAANTAITETGSARDHQLHYAAEAGAQLGVRWAKTYAKAEIGNPAWPAVMPFVITVGDAGWMPLNGMQVKVSLLPGPGGPDPDDVQHILRVQAKDEHNQGTLEINWDISDVQPDAPAPIFCKFMLSNWREQYLP